MYGYELPATDASRSNKQTYQKCSATIWFRIYTTPRIQKTHLHALDNNFSFQVQYVMKQLPQPLPSETTIIKTINKNDIATIFS
jgi:hypothetical protein